MQSNRLILADIFENFDNKFIKTYELYPAPGFLSTPGLAYQGSLTKTEIALELLTNINMPQIVEKRIRGGIWQFINKKRQIINTQVIKESSYLIYWDLNTIYGWAMSWKLPLDNFEWKKKQIKVWCRFYNKNIHSWNGCWTSEETTKETQWSTIFAWKNEDKNFFEKLVSNLHDKENYVVHIMD